MALVGLYFFVVCCTLAQEVFSFLFPFLLTLTFITAFQLLWPKEDKEKRQERVIKEMKCSKKKITPWLLYSIPQEKVGEGVQCTFQLPLPNFSYSIYDLFVSITKFLFFFFNSGSDCALNLDWLWTRHSSDFKIITCLITPWIVLYLV